LCKKENCIVAASELTFTDNGISAICGYENSGAASTVCKWGGGHSKKKKEKNNFHKKEKMMDKSCK